MQSYHVYLTGPDGVLEWQSAREVHAHSIRDAALLAIRLAPGNNPARVAIRQDKKPIAWCWFSDSPKHPNGAPICVHRLELERKPDDSE